MMKNNKQKLIFLIDFDGTVVTHSFPDIGKDVGAVPVLKDLLDNDHKLILYTIRSNNKNKNYLDEAIEWFKSHDIKLYGVNKNPTQINFSSSNKVHGDICIDDRNLGTPLIFNPELSDRPFVDWVKINCLLIDKNILKNK